MVDFKAEEKGKLRWRRMELFNEEFCNYNPLFVGQGDSPTFDQAFQAGMNVPHSNTGIDDMDLSGIEGDVSFTKIIAVAAAIVGAGFVIKKVFGS